MEERHSEQTSFLVPKRSTTLIPENPRRSGPSFRYGTTLPKHFVMDEGILQYCVLSMTLLALLFNVPVIPHSVLYFLYVDDLALYISGAILSCMKRQLQQAIDKSVTFYASGVFHFLSAKQRLLFLS